MQETCYVLDTPYDTVIDCTYGLYCGTILSITIKHVHTQHKFQDAQIPDNGECIYDALHDGLYISEI